MGNMYDLLATDELSLAAVQLRMYLPACLLYGPRSEENGSDGRNLALVEGWMPLAILERRYESLQLGTRKGQTRI